MNLSSKDIQTIFITLDPQRDTVGLMSEYLSNFNEIFLGLTGDENDIIQLSKSWGIYRKIVPIDTQDYSLDHTSTIFLINKNSSLGGTIAFREASEVAIAKIKNLIERNS